MGPPMGPGGMMGGMIDDFGVPPPGGMGRGPGRMQGPGNCQLLESNPKPA